MKEKYKGFLERLMFKIEVGADLISELLVPDKKISYYIGELSLPKLANRIKYPYKKPLIDVEKKIGVEPRAEEMKKRTEEYKKEQREIVENFNSIDDLSKIKKNLLDWRSELKDYSSELKKEIERKHKEELIYNIYRFEYYLDAHAGTILRNINEITHLMKVDEFMEQMKKREEESRIMFV
ncbi:MAG TPA: hypothetical protein ENF99_00620 [Candidatus Aenigmarchaeota archaeon]|nr:hypothetical protein [Candidatus Aenigmarchaeota archaeon]